MLRPPSPCTNYNPLFKKKKEKIYILICTFLVIKKRILPSHVICYWFLFDVSRDHLCPIPLPPPPFPLVNRAHSSPWPLALGAPRGISFWESNKHLINREIVLRCCGEIRTVVKCLNLGWIFVDRWNGSHISPEMTDLQRRSGSCSYWTKQ